MWVKSVITTFFLITAFCFGCPHTANAKLASGSLFVYIHYQLISLRQDATNHLQSQTFPLRYGGRRQKGDAAEEKNARESPSIIMGNIGSLDNKMDKFTAQVRHNREFNSLMCFTETLVYSGI